MVPVVDDFDMAQEDPVPPTSSNTENAADSGVTEVA